MIRDINESSYHPDTLYPVRRVFHGFNYISLRASLLVMHQRLPPVMLVLRSDKEHRSRQMIGLTTRDALCERRKNPDLSGRNQASATDLTHKTEDARKPTRTLSRTLLISFSSITLLATMLYGSFLSVRSYYDWQRLLGSFAVYLADTLARDLVDEVTRQLAPMLGGLAYILAWSACSHGTWPDKRPHPLSC